MSVFLCKAIPLGPSHDESYHDSYHIIRNLPTPRDIARWKITTDLLSKDTRANDALIESEKAKGHPTTTKHGNALIKSKTSAVKNRIDLMLCDDKKKIKTLVLLFSAWDPTLLVDLAAFYRFSTNGARISSQMKETNNTTEGIRTRLM